MKKLLVLLTSSLPFLGTAQEVSLDSLYIKGSSKTAQEQKEFIKNGQSTELLTSYELDRNISSYIDQSLNTLPGVQVERRTLMGGQRITLRGYGNDQKFNNWGIKMYWNNMPLTNADGTTLLDDVDFSTINLIEVIKGPAATLYGGGVGGVVKLKSLPQNTNSTSIQQNTTLGSFNYLQSITKVETGGDKFNITANYGHVESKGYRPYGANNKNFFNTYGTIKLTDSNSINFLITHANSFEQVPGQISFEDYYNGIDNGNQSYIRRNAKSKIVTTRLGVGHDWTILPELKNSTTLFYSTVDHHRIASGAYEYSITPSYGIRSVVDWNKTWGDFTSHTEFGLEIQRTDPQISNFRFRPVNESQEPDFRPISASSYFKYKNNSSNYFVVEKLTFTPWQITFLGGVSFNTLNYSRNDLLALPGLINGYDKNLSFYKKFDAVATPHFALTKKWNKQIFNLSYSEGYNAPTAATAFIAGSGLTNDHLSPEKAKMVDFSVQGLLFNSNFDYQISLYSIDITNKLTQLYNNVDDYSYWANTGNQQNKGIEISLGYTAILNGSIIKKILPFTNFAFTKNTYKSFRTFFEDEEVDYSGNKVVGTPNTKYTFGLDFELNKGFYWQTTYNYLSEVFTDFENTNAVKGYQLLNSKIGYKKSFGKFDFNAYFLVNNITNQIHYTFLFLGNNINDSDRDNGYPDGVTTDITPGPSKAYSFGGINLKYNF